MTNLNRDDVLLGELLDAWRDAMASEMHVALPGRVEAYTAPVADVQPMVQRALPTTTDSITHEIMPVIRCVPVIQARAGGYFLHLPVQAGDGVLIIVCERDFSRWRQTGELSRTPDTRLHHLAHAVCLPGFFPNTSPLTPAPSAEHLELGSESGPRIVVTGSEIQAGGSDELALAQAVADELTAIRAALEAAVAPSGGGPVEYGPAAYSGPGAIGTRTLKGA